MTRETLALQGFHVGRPSWWCRSVNPKVEGSSPSPGAIDSQKPLCRKGFRCCALGDFGGIRADFSAFSIWTGTGAAQGPKQRVGDHEVRSVGPAVRRFEARRRRVPSTLRGPGA